MNRKGYLIDNENLMIEWDWAKNSELGIDPKKVSMGSDIRVWWKCRNGHSWQAGIRPRAIAGTKCPYCSGKKAIVGVSDLTTTHPELCLEWDYEKNINISPLDVSKGSTQKIWWKGRCGHEWEATVGSRAAGSGCPYCSNVKVLIGYNDLLTQNPEVAREWHPTKNGELHPQDFVAGSGKNVWWKCKTCGYEWKTRISNRTKSKGTGCPKCKIEQTAIQNATPLPGESLFDLNPKLAEEWHPIKNGKLTSKDVFPNSGKKVWWKCIVGHEWEATIGVRNRGIGCIQCSKEKQTSYPEQVVYYYISKLFPDAINRYSECNKEIDIYIPTLKIGIEYDGMFFHGSESVDKERSKDYYFAQNGIRVIHIKERQCLTSDITVEENKIFYSPQKNYYSLPAVIEILIKMLYEGKNEHIPEFSISIERDNSQILESYLLSLKENSVLTNESLIKEWNFQKNGLLNPQYISSNSRHKVWWRCDKGHEWQAVIASRTAGNGCPYCSNVKVLIGYNDLLTQNPEVAREWHPTKNGELHPQDFVAGSGKNVWWKCKTCGYEWKTSIINRTKFKGTKCPCCTNKIIVIGRNDLATLYPSLLKEWNFQRNKDVDPYMVSSGSSQQVWWRCKSGHEWKTAIYNRTKENKSGCPYCSNKKVIQGQNDLATINPALASEWNIIKNGENTPNMFSYASSRKVWWKCKEGHEWEAIISNRSKGRGCPYCAGQRVLTGINDLLSVKPELAKEWDYELNDCLPSEVHHNNQSKKIHWICSRCGYRFIYKISKRIRCPECRKKEKQINVYDIETLTFLYSFENAKLMCEFMNLDYNKMHGVISMVCNRKQKTLMGKYILRYASDDEFYLK